MPAAAVDSQMLVVRTVEEARKMVRKWRAEGLSVGLVPTMGALHEGHLSLIRRSNALAERTIASIFVNPAQFAPHEDFGTYPRREETDLALLKKEGCDLVFAPSSEEMYPAGFQTAVSVASVSQGLCGASRPHFFGGVATVVCKLLNQVAPDIAVFGEKDYQQLLVIRRMAKDLDLPVEIVGAPIVREADGLAMSSRNAYLNADERKIAGALNKVLSKMADRLSRGDAIGEAIHFGRTTLGEAGFTSIDYLEIRNAETLEPAGSGAVTAPSRIFAAVILGSTRLIDNWPVTSDSR
ncbi:MAG TPA: pantoate--beta-alanine ligase, partial [Parvularculaceae bacterium]|nr:pantoate--beta-alanine ligase [Parvularculaceae bacterium]